MKSKLALLTFFLMLVLIGNGGYLTGVTRVLPGAPATPASDPSLAQFPQIFGYVVGALALVASFGASTLLGIAAVVLVAAEALTPGHPFLHAICAPLLFVPVA